MKSYKILDLFSGAGGFSYGVELVDGFKTVIAVDFDKEALETFQNNFHEAICINGDITDSGIKKRIIDLSIENKVNMVIGGPPCQGFSLKGKNLGLQDERNFLFLEYYNIVKEVNPEIFVIENVKNLISSGNGYFLKEIYDIFSKLGYYVSHKILNAKNYGVPQNRERAIIIGSKERKISLPDITLKKYVTVKDAISDLSYLESGEGSDLSEYKLDSKSDYEKLMRNNMTALYNHKATNHSKIAIDKLALIPPEGNKSYLPKELHGKQKFNTTWSRLKWDEVSPTIDTRFDTPSNGKNSHPYLNRAITPREAARLQSFPDSFIFYGKKTSICRQIGNSVPPLLGKGIAEHIKQELKK